MNVRSGFAQSRRFEKRFPLDSGRCPLCAAAGLVRRLGKAIAQGMFLLIKFRKDGSAYGQEREKLSVTDGGRDTPVMAHHGPLDGQ